MTSTDGHRAGPTTGAGGAATSEDTAPTVRDGHLSYPSAAGRRLLRVGTPEWFDWLSRAEVVRVEHPAGAFVLRRERAGNRRGRTYWRAHRRVGGARRRAYVGPDHELTWPRVDRLGTTLAAGAGTGADPERSPAVPRQRPPVADAAPPYRGAARWYLDHDRPRDAIDTLLDAGDLDGAVVELRRLAETDGALWSDVSTVARWVRALPGAVVGHDPVLRLLAEWPHAQYRLIPAPPMAEPARPHDGDAPPVPGALAAVRCFGATGDGYADEALDTAREALSDLPAEQWTLRAVAAFRCLDPLGHGLRPDLVDLSGREFGRLAARSTDPAIRVTARLGLAVLDGLRGRLTGSLAQCARSAAEAARGGLAAEDYLPAQPQRALCLLERGDPAAAAAALADADPLAADHPDVGLAIQVRHVRAEVRGATGDVPGAVAALDELDDAVSHTPGLAGTPFEAVARRSTALRRARIHLLAGDPVSARRVLPGDDAPLPPGPALFEDLVRAHLHVVEGDPDAALARVAMARRDHGAVVDVACWLRIGLLAAVAHHRLGRPADAAHRLAAAVSLGLPGGYRLPYTELAADLARIARRAPHTDPLLRAVPRLLGVAGPPTDALTGRELDVLRAFAAGSSTAEAAAYLGISAATVAAHGRSIHRKLRARTRAQAVAHAYRDGLLRG